MLELVALPMEIKDICLSLKVLIQFNQVDFKCLFMALENIISKYSFKTWVYLLYL